MASIVQDQPFVGGANRSFETWYGCSVLVLNSHPQFGGNALLITCLSCICLNSYRTQLDLQFSNMILSCFKHHWTPFLFYIVQSLSYNCFTISLISIYFMKNNVIDRLLEQHVFVYLHDFENPNCICIRLWKLSHSWGSLP